MGFTVLDTVSPPIARSLATEIRVRLYRQRTRCPTDLALHSNRHGRPGGMMRPLRSYLHWAHQIVRTEIGRKCPGRDVVYVSARLVVKWYAILHNGTIDQSAPQRGPPGVGAPGGAITPRRVQTAQAANGDVFCAHSALRPGSIGTRQADERGYGYHEATVTSIVPPVEGVCADHWTSQSGDVEEEDVDRMHLHRCEVRRLRSRDV